MLENLDAADRLVLAAAKDIGPDYESGAFGVGKDLDVDRLISDARGPNSRERPVNHWTKLPGFPSLLSYIRLQFDEVLAQYGDDILDYYPSLVVSHIRARRNAFRFPMWPHEASHFKSFRL